MCNPQWGPKMEEEFRAQLSEQGYVHEILAEFGSQETGVFDKDKLDRAMKQEMYAYMPLTYSQQHKVKTNNWQVDMMIPPANMNIGTYRPNVFRTMGVNLSLPYAGMCRKQGRELLERIPTTSSRACRLTPQEGSETMYGLPRTGKDIVHIISTNVRLG